MKFVVVSLIAMAAVHGQEFTRGVGVYPGDPNDYAGPSMVEDSGTYRNLALHRPAYHSSAYDYNLTAQLVTDGIKDTRLPRWVATSTSQNGLLKKNEREWLLDGNWVSNVELRGKERWVQVQLGGGDAPLEVDRIEVDGKVMARGEPENWTVTVLGAEDGQRWTPLGVASDMAHTGGDMKACVRLQAVSKSRYYRLVFDDPRANGFQVGEVRFFRAGKALPVGGPFDFTSAWMAAGKGEEWVSVDLGAVCTFDRVAMHWIRRAGEGAVQVSDDGSNWRTIQPLGKGDDLKLVQPATGRWVRVLMTRPETDDGYVLSELEVHGRGGPLAKAKAAPARRNDGRLELAGGDWRVQRVSQVRDGGEAISKAGYRAQDWVVATVPGTVIASYLNAGAIPDPNFGDNQLMISDSYFCADFWYRDEFTGWQVEPGKHVWLNFDGINWKADVFFNGEKLGRIEGGFIRGRFDVTKLMRAGQRNAVAVRIEKNATPGSVKEKTFENPDKNGGALGADNPTYHATIGWDWIPTIRGRDTGIWGGVSLNTTGGVTIESTLVTSALPMPDTSRAEVTVEAVVRNHGAAPATGTVRGRFGDLPFTMPVSIGPNAESTVKTVLRVENPRLWWPNGYGAQNLYDVRVDVESGTGVSDSKAFQAGIRQFTYSEDGGSLRMWVNGRRFIPKGGNWGFSESMLRYRAREYDIALRYHKEMNFNMVRNWVGQIGDDPFYEACDRHGIVVWQDFWLANPWDGPDPDDNAMFLRNSRDLIARIRNHPSIGLYCGRNEGYPPKPLDDAIRGQLAQMHPGLHYISSSADDVVSGHGPYRAMPFEFYFAERATVKMHSEMGMPNIVTMDSLRQMMPESGMWPLGRMWGLHDFCLNGAQGGQSFIDRIKKSYGDASNISDWLKLAQFVNYEGHRAMFESQSRNRMGLLIWMSHPTWPSFVWQTYDYYFEPTAAYFGSKKGSEPLHIQWNPVTNNVEVVNYSGGNAPGLTARVEVLNVDGSLKWEKSATLDSAEDSTATPIRMEYPAGLSAVHFLRLKLTRGQDLVSENFYWRGTEEGNYRAIGQLPKVKVEANTRRDRKGDVCVLTTELRNTGDRPALLVALKAVREKAGDRILPAIYSDNYVSLMPGERRTVVTELRNADTRGEAPQITVEGYNTAP